MTALALEDYSSAALLYLAATALIAGISRGFSGFGAALIFIPLASAAVGPRSAAPLLLIIDAVAAASLIPRAWRGSDKREVGIMTLGAVLGVPLGTFVLSRSDPVAIRWMIAAMVAAMLALLASGWRYHGRPAVPLTIGVGGLAGFFSGVAQVGGPPVVAYWLGSRNSAETVRANIILYFAISTAFTMASYFVGDLLTGAVLGLAIVTGPLYGLGLLIGARMFGLASEQTFRRVCYAIIGGAAIVGLPVLDGVIR